MRTINGLRSIAWGCAVSAALLSSACDKETIGPDPAKPVEMGESGSRIKVKRVAGKDGSKAFVSMYDTEMKTDCAFTTAADGMTRCLPSRTLELTDGDGDFYFADDACTIQLGRWKDPNPHCDPPAYASGTLDFEEAGLCKPGIHVFQVTSPQPFLAFADGYYYNRSAQGTGCWLSGSASESAHFFPLGAELAPTSFVEGSEVIE